MYIAGEEVSWTTKAKYLDQGLTFKDHANYMVNMTKIAIGRMGGHIGRKFKLKLTTKL